MDDAFYRDLGGGRYGATPATAGPWGPKTQHAGPPSALLGHAMECHQPREGFRIARVSVEIPRPVPVGELEPTPLTRALTLADSNWAIGSELDYVRQLVINLDVTLALHRDPVGEWLCLRSQTAASPAGGGLAEGQLHDLAGDCGRVLQTLFVAPR